MNESAQVTMAIVMVVGLLAAPAAAVSDVGVPASVGDHADEEQDYERDTEETADGGDRGDEANVSAGERLAGVVGVQKAEIDGEIGDRTFGIAVARAASDDAKADVVADRLHDADERLEELEAEAERLAEKRENGSITEGKYRARMAKIGAEKRNVERAVNQSAVAAEELPVEVLEEKGINATAIATLQDRASELGGPDVSEIARTIAGPDVGQGMAGDKRPVDVGNATGAGDDAGPAGAGGAGDDAADDAGPDAGDDGTNETAVDSGDETETPPADEETDGDESGDERANQGNA